MEQGTLTVFLSGRIDSSNSENVKKELMDLVAAEKPNALVFDCDDLQYISSAGLRVVLTFKKQYPSLELVNVGSEVYEILDVTGFAEMMTVKKAYKRVSVDGCEVIGTGANGLVYRLDPDTIVKVYRNPDSLEEIKKERELARKAFVMGIPTAIPYDIVRVGNSYGSVFELLNAKSFLKLLKADPSRIDELVNKSVEILKIMHGTEVEAGVLPEEKAVALRWLDSVKDILPERTYTKLGQLLRALSDRRTILHGDYHFKNIMMQNDEAWLIDMDTLCSGDPIFEFAFIYNAYVGFGAYDETVVTDFLGIPMDLAKSVWKKTVKAYTGVTDDEAFLRIERKAKIIGYLRLVRRYITRGLLNEEKNVQAHKFFLKELIDCVDQTDSLSIDA